MPKRIETHRIDTKAVRHIFTHLNEHWLVRSLDERDYGIDLQLERYDMDDATGDFIFVQVKGTDAEFKDSVKLGGFPVDTINYALMFDVPFFLFHTSNASKQTKFVWLQKYVELKLDRDTPNWKSQDSVTIYFPDENDLQSNDDKIADIIRREKLRKVGVKFLADYEALALHGRSVIADGQIGVAQGCASLARRLLKLSSFIEEYRYLVQEGDYADFSTLPSAFDNINTVGKVDSADRDTVISAMKFLKGVKDAFLSQDEHDELREILRIDSAY
ncbi:DUF4365 domain-containing protein [Massilia sp. WG5]|uniref:DUF4365 domain-containing protein n=1 Tax=Massilia sp. WG5 TaxID=1707785 RepID=UPI000705D4C2|nr:DUF4365 domain-containing protein [Massilia sp. WG5]ALK96606.1 hypothetical protein AM586_10310 [Massilia sp. WG5]